MRLRSLARFTSVISIALLTASPVLANPRLHRGPTSPRFSRAHTAPAPKPRASMDADRATQIQTALIKSGYLTGEPTGTWDAASQAAMQKLQAENGWQTKLVPDARALTKLGLGPGTTPATPSTLEPAEAETETPASTSVPAN